MGEYRNNHEGRAVQWPRLRPWLRFMALRDERKAAWTDPPHRWPKGSTRANRPALVYVRPFHFNPSFSGISGHHAVLALRMAWTAPCVGSDCLVLFRNGSWDE